MKRSISLILCMVLTLTLLPALAATPNPIPELAPEELQETPLGITNYLLLCVDSWNGKADNLGNTDGMMLVTVDRILSKITVTSFLRDTLIQKPEGGFNRLSRFVPQNGHNQEAVEKLLKVYATHFGVRIDHYIVVDWSMIQRIIDICGVKDENGIGRVEVYLYDGEVEYLRARNAYKSNWSVPVMRGGGTYMINGRCAVDYMRCRRSVHKYEGEANDFRRTTRGRNILTSLARSLADVSYDQASELLTAVADNILLTDMSLADMWVALDLAYSLRQSEIAQLRIPMDGTYENIEYNGGACIQIDYLRNRDMLLSTLYGGYVVREEDEDWP